jgi:predicted ATP-grasp superfamily ATP-dependent carboligase
MKTIVQEFKDKKGAHRLRVIAPENGKILDSSTQGYSNKSEMISAHVRAAKAVLDKYFIYGETGENKETVLPES